jgi:hypothetical protein
MKGKFLTWETFKELDPTQTAVILTYSSPSIKRFKVPFTRVLVGQFGSRQEAWEWCKANNVRRTVLYEENQPIEIGCKLLRLSKLIKEYAQTHPKRVSAILVRT